ncbi:ADP-ribosyltransferase, partial [Aerococcus urinae]
DAKEWLNKLTAEEKRAITKYTFNGKDPDGLRLFEKINGYLDGYYKPVNSKEEKTLLKYAGLIEKGLLRYNLQRDIIVYRKDFY